MLACLVHDAAPFAIYVSLLAGTLYACWPLWRTHDR
jgi:hypothetical protein